MSEGRPAALRAVIVGAGLMGRWHGDAIARAGGRVAAVCDVDLEAAQALARRLKASAHTELVACLEAERPDVVHVCTPLEAHRPVAEHALERGVHAIVEKPLAASAREVEELLALAAGKGAVLCPVHQLVFQRWLPRIARLGQVLEVHYSARSAGAVGRPPADADAIVAEILPHPLSLFERIHGGSLGESDWSVSRPASGELRARATARGASLSLSISMNGRPPSQELTVSGTQGTLHADLFHGFSTLENGRVSRLRKIGRPFETAVGQLAAGAANLARRAATRELAYPGLHELVRAVHTEIRGGPRALSQAHARRVALARDEILSRSETPAGSRGP